MTKFFAVVFAVGLSLAGVTAADAAGGCGIGWHQNAYGRCVHNWADPDAHACARGWHLGPEGHCIANYAHPDLHACARGWHLNPYGHCVANY